MPRIPYRYPALGEDVVADRVRQRRGARGLTPLDGSLLHSPAITDGWNTLLGAVRTKNSLPADVRELMILRVAACNSATFEWVHHEPVGRDAGLTTQQLSFIRDTSTPLSSTTKGPLSPLQSAALAYADAMTRQVKVPSEIFDRLRQELSKSSAEAGVTVEQQLVEATVTVGTYNMVSRFLVALDVDDKADTPVPDPATATATFTGTTTAKVPIPSGGNLHSQFHKSNDPSAPTLVFVNSLLTNVHLWDSILPKFPSYNLITFDQRGHGLSDIPPTPCTIPELADDVALVMTHFKIQKAKAVIGVSQGGATTLSFSIRHPERTEKIIACDTQPASPSANKAAWDERISLARSEGMNALADATIPRWFAPGTSFTEEKNGPLVREMIESTPVDGFAAGAAALQDYDLFKDGLVDALRSKGGDVLLIAGERDGKIPDALEGLVKKVGGGIGFEVVPVAGHLPMVDQPEAWAKVVSQFLER